LATPFLAATAGPAPSEDQSDNQCQLFRC
jgi:hypothetical protein